MTKRISQASTVVVPAAEAHAAAAKAAVIAQAAIAAAAAEVAEAKADAAAETAEAPEADPVIMMVAPVPMAVVDPSLTVEPAAAGAAAVQDDTGGERDVTPYIVGGVLLAGGILAIALSGDDDDNSPPPPPPSPVTTVTISSAATASVAENTAAGATGVVAIDVNAAATATNGGTPGAVTYTLGGTDAASFQINSSTGEVRFNTSPNFEAKASYSITVTANAAANGTTPAASSTAQAITINVTNVNEAPSFANATATASIAENSPTTTVVYTAPAATDPDAGTTLTYSLAGADAAAFNFDAATRALTFKASPDFETKATYNVNIVASDAATGGLTGTLAVTVNVTDVPEGTVLVGAQTLSAAGANVAYTESAATANTSSITGFGVGDTITVDVATSNYSFTNNGANLVISYANGAIVNQITLVGAVPATAVVFSEASAEAAVGSNFFLSGANVPAPPTQTATLSGTETLSAANAAVTYNENAGAANTTTINNFGPDDRIVVTGATAGSYSFTNNGANLIISFANGSIVNQITLVGAVNPNAIITNEADAEAAISGVGADFFRYA